MFQLAAILVLGVGAQWLSWRLRIPSILLLLVFGFAAGPLTGLLDPDALFGDLLLPIVSLSVATILLEGGLSLRLRDLRGGGRAVLGLLVAGIPLTLVLSAWLAQHTLALPLGLSILLGAVLVVTGPTVIVPLLSHVRPSGTVGSVARWEGIVNDPVGAILAALVSAALLAPNGDTAAYEVALGALRGLTVGAVLGFAAALFLVQALRRFWAPDELSSPLVLGTGMLVYVAANAVEHEAGLTAVTLLGIALANQKTVPIAHIVEFKENLRVLLIAVLFIVLAARVPADALPFRDPGAWVFFAGLVLLVRPVATLVATTRSGLSWRERVFLSFLAPRGIVAAAVTSVFALELSAAHYPGAERLVGLVFFVIVGTVTLYGLGAAPLARRLGLAVAHPQGVLQLGAHDWAREIARALTEAGFRVVLVDTNRAHVRAARLAGLEAHHGSILAEDLLEHVSLEGIGRLLCLSSSDEVNALATAHLGHLFERSDLFQLAPESLDSNGETPSIPLEFRGRMLFGEGVTFWELSRRFHQGATIKRTTLSDEFDLDDLRATWEAEGAEVLPLFVVRSDGRLVILSADEPLDAEAGDTVLSLITPGATAGPGDTPG